METMATNWHMHSADRQACWQRTKSLQPCNRTHGAPPACLANQLPNHTTARPVREPACHVVPLPRVLHGGGRVPAAQPKLFQEFVHRKCPGVKEPALQEVEERRTRVQGVCSTAGVGSVGQGSIEQGRQAGQASMRAGAWPTRNLAAVPMWIPGRQVPEHWDSGRPATLNLTAASTHSHP